MQVSEMEKFQSLLTDVLAYYGKPVSKFTLAVWWQACRVHDFEMVEKAMQKHATDPDRGQFAPKVADIAKAMGGTTTERAALAWGKVHEAMSAVGAWQDVVFDDPAIHAVVDDLGGWVKVCRTDMKELPYLQHRFQEAHRAYTDRGNFEYPRRLCGARDPDHEYESRGIPLPRPYLVGDTEKCMAVIRLGGAAGKQAISQLPRTDMRALLGNGLRMMVGHDAKRTH